MSEAKNKLFGRTTMREMLASAEDIVGSAQRVDAMPDAATTPVGTIVQLCHPQTGYILGRYYELNSSKQWIDVSTSVPLSEQKVVGCYILLGHRLFLVWGDPAGTEDVHWVKTVIGIQDAEDSGTGGWYPLHEEDIPNNNPDGVMVKLNSEQMLVEKKTFMATAHFSNGTVTDALLTRFSMDKEQELVVMRTQSDWAETDNEEPSFIRNKPVLIRKIYINKAGELVIITDDPNARWYIDDNGDLILETPDDDSDEDLNA